MAKSIPVASQQDVIRVMWKVLKEVQLTPEQQKEVDDVLAAHEKLLLFESQFYKALERRDRKAKERAADYYLKEQVKEAKQWAGDEEPDV